MFKTNKLSGAIVGFGFISSQGHFPAYRARAIRNGDVEIVAICDICLEREQYVPHGIAFYSNFEELLKNELEKIDFIDIATPAVEHFRIAKKALELGIHVMCEKPLGITPEEISTLMQIALLNNCVLFPCHNYKFSPVVSEVRAQIKLNNIVNIRHISLATFRTSHALGTKEWCPDWRREFLKSGGGIAMDHGCHSLYLLFEWMGSYPISVTASSFNHSSNFKDTEDNYSAVFEFENGFANILLSWTAGVRKVTYSLHHDNGAILVNDDELELFKVSGSQRKISNCVQKKMIQSNWDDASHVNWFDKLFDEFSRAISQNDYLNKDLIDAYFCLVAITKSYESIQNNSQKIPLSTNLPNII